jgi:hypothetical protein
MTNDLLVAAGYDDARQVRDRFNLHPILQLENCLLDHRHPGAGRRLLVPHVLGKRFVVKTHSFPVAQVERLIRLRAMRPTYIYRDPRDVALSAYEHGIKIRAAGENHSFARYSTVAEAVHWVNGWPIRDWLKWMQRKDTLFVRYEDLLADPLAELRRLASFLRIHVPDETLETIQQRYQPDRLDKTQRDILHLNAARAGRFRNSLKPEELELARRELGGIVRQMGYPD